jgi:methionyl-tRNA synthetase
MIKTRYKKDLAGQLGNLLNRATAQSLLPNGTIPGIKHQVDPRDEMLHDQISTTAGLFSKKTSGCYLTKLNHTIK